MKGKRFVKFPCGLEIKSEFKSGWTEIGTFECDLCDIDPAKFVCPLHGKNCKSK